MPGPETIVVPSGDTALDRYGYARLEQRLRGLVLAFPGTAEVLLRTGRHLPDPVLRCTLRAEAVLCLGRPREAMAVASSAVDHAVRQQPVDPGRLLPAAAVMADAAVVAGAPDAVRHCNVLGELADRHRDQTRAVIAGGLHAVAAFQQHGCGQAVQLLHRLGRTRTDHAIAAALALACDSIADCCAHRDEPHWPPNAPPLVSAGGLVQPLLTPPVLADRILRRPGVHTCRTAHQAAHHA